MKKGSKFTDSQLSKLRESAKRRIGIPRTDATKAKISLSKINKKRAPFSSEWKQKISDGLKNSGAGKYVRTQEIKEKARVQFLGKKLPKEHAEKVVNALVSTNKKRIGIKHHNWKGGITTENHKIRNSSEYARWRTLVFERDNYTCVICYARSGIGKAVLLQADHIKQFAHFKELRFELSNGRTLCVECHKKTDTYGKK